MLSHCQVVALESELEDAKDTAASQASAAKKKHQREVQEMEDKLQEMEDDNARMLAKTKVDAGSVKT